MSIKKKVTVRKAVPTKAVVKRSPIKKTAVVAKRPAIKKSAAVVAKPAPKAVQKKPETASPRKTPSIHVHPKVQTAEGWIRGRRAQTKARG